MRLRHEILAAEAGEAILDVGRVADLAGLAVADDIDADGNLMRDDVGDRLVDLAVEFGMVVRLVLVLLHQQIDQRLRPRQAADMGRQDAVRAEFHGFLPCLLSRWSAVTSRASPARPKGSLRSPSSPSWPGQRSETYRLRISPIERPASRSRRSCRRRSAGTAWRSPARSTIVRDDDAGRLMREDFRFQPFLAGDVDMIGRLVHQVEIGLGQPQRQQAEPRLLSGRKIARSAAAAYPRRSQRRPAD